MSDLDVPDSSWGLSSREVSATMLDDFAAGKITLDELPTFNDWEKGFFKANRVDSGRKVAKVDVEIHHIIPKRISKLLRDKGVLPANFNPNTVPGHSYTKELHKILHDGENDGRGMNALMNRDGFDLLNADEIAVEIIQHYRSRGYDSMAKVAEAWFINKGIL